MQVALDNVRRYTMNSLNKIKIFVLILGLQLSYSQQFKTPEFAVNAKYFGLTYHPGGGADGGEVPYPRSIDDRGYWVLQVGAEVDFDYYINKFVQIRFANALFKDCIDVWSGHISLAPRVSYTTDFGLSARFGIGPTLIWRESWWKSNEVEWYNGDGFYGKEETDDAIQTAFLWYGGNIEVDYQITEKWGIAYSLIPGYPQVFSNSIGVRRYF
jgi:hypothetical protein